MLMEHREPRLSLPAPLLARLEQNDQEAWLAFFHQVYATACLAIDDALSPGDPAATKEAKQLVEALNADEADVLVAIDLALTSFWRHYLDQPEPPELRTEGDCAALLIRVAYNRWQRGRYRDRQSIRQADLGAIGGGDGPALIEQQPDRGPGPEDDVDLDDFLAALKLEVIRFTQHLTDTDRRIIHLHFFERLTLPEIKGRLEAEGVARVAVAKIQDVVRRWKQHLIQRYPRTLDFLSPDADL